MPAFSLHTCASKYQQIVDAILNAGPLVQDNLDDVRTIRDAVVRIKDRTTEHFGLSAGDEQLTDDELNQILAHPSVISANEKLGKAVGVSGDGNKGPFVDMLMQLIQLAMTNPQLLALILSLFKK